MHAVARVFVALFLLGLIAGCAPDRQLAPEAALLARGGANANTAPSNLTATALSHDQIALAWQDNTTNEQGFEYHWSTTGAGGEFSVYSTVSENVTAVTLGGFSGSTKYCFKVRSFVVRGRKTTYSNFSNVGCATTSATPVPAAPTATSATPYFGYAISVTWSAVDGAQSHFTIERAPTGTSSWTGVGSVSGDQRQWYDWYATQDVELCYRVIAHNGYGPSSPSVADCTGIPSAPSGLTATAGAPHSFDLHWESTSPVEDGFQVHRQKRGGTNVVVSLPANTLDYHDGGLEADSWYTYWVNATRDGGVSGISNQVEVSTGATGAPPAPGYLTAAPGSSSSVNVNWAVPSPSTTSYRVERSNDGGLTWPTIVTSTADPGFWDSGVVTEQVVCYRVYATNGFGESGASASSCTAPPAAPTNLQSQAFDEYYNNVTWTDNSSVEDGYLVYTYYYYDNGDGTYYYEEYSYWLPENSTSVLIGNWETLNFVVATRDGGWSDITYASSAGSSRATESAKLRQLRRGDGAARARQPLPGPAPKTKPQSKRGS